MMFNPQEGITGKWLQESLVISHLKPLNLLRWLFRQGERSERELCKFFVLVVLAKPDLIWFYSNLNI